MRYNVTMKKSICFILGLLIMGVLNGCSSKAEQGESGCTNVLACNYDLAATVNDGSCLVPDVDKCQVCSGSVILEQDDDLDGVCNDEEVLGCNNDMACNFNPIATENDGSCKLPNSSDCQYCLGGDVVTPATCSSLYNNQSQIYSLSIPEYAGSGLVAINFDNQELLYSIQSVSAKQSAKHKSHRGQLSCGTPLKSDKTNGESELVGTEKNSHGCSVPSEQSNTQLIYETDLFNVFIKQNQSQAVKDKVIAVIDRFESTALVNFKQFWYKNFYDVDAIGKINVYFIPDTGYLGYVVRTSTFCYYLVMDLDEVNDYGNNDNDLTMAHEFTHILQNYLYDSLQQEIYSFNWISEGIAEALGVVTSEIDCELTATCTMDWNYGLDKGNGIFGSENETAYQNAPQFFEYLRLQHGLTGKYHFEFMYEVESKALITQAFQLPELERGVDIVTKAHNEIVANEQIDSKFETVYDALVYFNLAKLIAKDSVSTFGSVFGYDGIYQQSGPSSSTGTGSIEPSGALFFKQDIPTLTTMPASNKLYYYYINLSN